MFFTYSQNNSGGSFVVDDNVAHFVVVEADNAEKADARAESIGIYFDGCTDGRDCECCGDRWYPTYDTRGSIMPEIYGKAVADYHHETLAEGSCMADWCHIRVHYRDGRVERFDGLERRN